MPELVEVRRHDHAAVVTLQREDKLNAVSTAMERALCDALERSEVRQAPCVVFTGGPRVFSAGADVTEMTGMDPAAVVEHYHATGDFAERVAALPVPTISAVAGWCVGGGLELALATDFRVVERGATFGLPEVELGILPSWGGTQRLVRLLGPARAKEIILIRSRFEAQEAHALGLVTELVADGTSLERALALAQRLTELPPLAVKVTLEVIDAMPETSQRAGLALERLAYGLLAQTGEHDQAASTQLAR